MNKLTPSSTPSKLIPVGASWLLLVTVGKLPVLLFRSLTLLLVCGDTSGHFSWAGPNGLEAPLDGDEFTLSKK